VHSSNAYFCAAGNPQLLENMPVSRPGMLWSSSYDDRNKLPYEALYHGLTEMPELNGASKSVPESQTSKHFSTNWNGDES